MKSSPRCLASPSRRPWKTSVSHFENRLLDKLKVLAKYKIFIINEIGCLLMDIQGANLFFQLSKDAPDFCYHPPKNYKIPSPFSYNFKSALTHYALDIKFFIQL